MTGLRWQAAYYRHTVREEYRSHGHGKYLLSCVLGFAGTTRSQWVHAMRSSGLA